MPEGKKVPHGEAGRILEQHDGLSGSTASERHPRGVALCSLLSMMRRRLDSLVYLLVLGIGNIVTPSDFIIYISMEHIRRRFFL